jgi:nitroreductase
MTLYDTILTRRSARRYDGRPVPETLLAAVRDYAPSIAPLQPGVDFRYQVVSVDTTDSITAAMGGYGLIVSAPHVIAPMLAASPHALVDFGFRTQQLVVFLTQLGLGSCWVGALLRERKALLRFGAPPGFRIGAVIAFGYPDARPTGRTINDLIRVTVGANRKKPLERFVWAERFGAPAKLTSAQARALQALRAAPSTGNAQPWQVVIRKGTLFLAVQVDATYYVLSGNRGYHLVDAGIGMANLWLALRDMTEIRPGISDRVPNPLAESGHVPRWTLLDEQPDLSAELGLPGNMRLVASIPLPD